MMGLWWSSLVQWWPYSERALFTVGSCIVHSTSFFGLNGLLYLIYHYNLFNKYKIQGPQKWPDRKLVLDCLKGNIFSHLVIGPISLWLLYPIFKKYGMPVDEFPSALHVLGQCAIFFLINDFCFYWAHRLLHHRLIYGHIHKKHHNFKATIGIAAEYAHPIEDLIANSFPTIAGPLFMNCHMGVFWFYLAIRVWETVDAHSGYEFPWSPWCQLKLIQGGADRHDFHHSHNVGNFGLLHIWDWLMGTDTAYNQWKLKKNDNVNVKAPTPASETIDSPRN